MQILVACEESQAVTIALRKLGHEAYSCDLIPCSGGHPEWHIQQDVLPLLNGYCFFKTCDGSAHYVLGRWDMLIAFPPCTYLTNASAVRMRVKGEIVAERYAKAMEAKAFFMSFLSADCAKIAVENPTPATIPRRALAVKSPSSALFTWWRALRAGSIGKRLAGPQSAATLSYLIGAAPRKRPVPSCPPASRLRW